MTVSKYNPPTQSSDTFPEYKNNIDASIRVNGEVAANFAPRESDTPAMTVTIEAGKVWNGSSFTAKALQTTSVITAPSVNPRIDRIVINTNTGTYAIITGAEAASPVAPVFGVNQYPICQIALVLSQTTILNADITDERVLVNTAPTILNKLDATAAPAVTDDANDGYQIGSRWVDVTADEEYVAVDVSVGAAVWKTTTAAGGGAVTVNWGLPFKLVAGTSFSTTLPEMCEMTANTIALYDYIISELRVYKFNGTTWAEVGTGLVLTSKLDVSLTRLSDTEVAWYDGTDEELRHYTWSGSAWTLDGSAFAITGGARGDLCTLSSTDVVWTDNQLDELRVYRWGGSTWTLQGSALAAVAIQTPAVATLTDTDIAYINVSDRVLKTYRWSGSAWSQVGNSSAAITISGVDLTIARLDSSTIVLVAGGNNEMVTYQFDGTDWAKIGGEFAFTSLSDTSLATLNGTDIVFLDGTVDEIQIYRFGFSL